MRARVGVSQQRTVPDREALPVRKTRSAALAVLAFALFTILAGPAAARDRNHDRIPDRWEKRHHLSLKVNQAKRDQDRDGLRNRAEFRAGLDPRDDDSDDDGLEDGDENAGTIQSFNAATGRLTIGSSAATRCRASSPTARRSSATTTTATAAAPAAATRATTTMATATTMTRVTTGTTRGTAAPRRSRQAARSRRPS